MVVFAGTQIKNAGDGGWRCPVCACPCEARHTRSESDARRGASQQGGAARKAQRRGGTPADWGVPGAKAASATVVQGRVRQRASTVWRERMGGNKRTPVFEKTKAAARE